MAGTPGATARTRGPHGRAPRRAARARTGVARAAEQGVPGAMRPELKEAIESFVSTNKIVLFMKGTKEAPRCGFSNTVVMVLKSMEVPFETVDVLADDSIRTGMKEFSQWPTFPQLYVDGEFYGGCDIVVEAYKSGDLIEEVERVLAE